MSKWESMDVWRMEARLTELDQELAETAVEFLLLEDKLTVALSRATAAEAECERLRPYEAAIRNRHNGYDPEARKAMPELKEPATPTQALKELHDEYENECSDYLGTIEKLRGDYDELLGCLRIVATMGHGNCKKERCCTHCMAKEKIDRIVSNWKGGIVRSCDSPPAALSPPPEAATAGEG